MNDDHLKAWDRDYSAKGRLFGGTPANLPDIPRGSLVLELGCGDGKTLCAMGSKGWEITAMDYSRGALHLCREQCGRSYPIRFVRSDARYLPFRDDTFGVVFATHIMGHLLANERSMAAGEIFRVLRPGGSLFFRDFGTGDFRCGKGRRIEEQTFSRGSGTITHYFTADEIDGLFSGFRQVAIFPERWSMTVRGRKYGREEIAGIFAKARS